MVPMPTMKSYVTYCTEQKKALATRKNIPKYIENLPINLRISNNFSRNQYSISIIITDR